MKEVFKRLIIDFFERELSLIERELPFPLDTKKVVFLVGIRRSGKTYLLFQAIKRLRRLYPRENLIYINFEDDRLSGLSLSHLDEFIEAYFELFPEKRRERLYLFLDEVQAVEGWEKFVRRLHDTLNIHLYVTGSSSKLMSREIATSLRGRTITYEVFPLSFREFLRFKGIEVNLYSSERLSYIKKAFFEYLRFGGFPEVVLEEREELKRKILSDYAILVIYRDLAERYEIKNLALLKFIIKYVFQNPATFLSLNKFYHNLKSFGYKLSRETLSNYLAYLEEIYAIFQVPLFTFSLREQQRNPKKIFIIDNGFKTLYTLPLKEDYSQLYENLVFLQLRRKYSEIYYFKENQEVDFYVPEAGLLINVCYDLSSKETYQREINSLIEGMKKLGLKEGILLTSETEREIKVENYTIRIKPLWKWLLEEEIF